jgi:citrate lyase subunit beta/citryl-CoA lyase
MAATFRPRRSVLYMPGSNARAQEKAKSIPADAIILDLEDAVAPDAKSAARETVCNSVRQGGYGGREMIIRINSLDTPWGLEDLRAAVSVQPDAILVPKVESAEMVHKVESLMDASGALATTAIWCMIETPRGILKVADIAAASTRLGALVMGTSDLVKDVHARHTPLRLPMLTALSLSILAARAEGLAVLDGVYLDLQDTDGFRNACVQGLEFGFDGKTLIHPSQVEPCNEVYAPDAAEVDLSRRIIEAFAAAEKEGKGVVVVDGKLVENLHVDNAKRLVALAEAIENLQAA